MARNRTEEATEATESQAATTAAPETAVVSDDRYRKVKLADGTLMNRKDFIKKRWAEGVSRGDIAKELTELNTVANGGNGKKVPYQVVFAVIKKGTPGGPAPVAPATAEAAAS